MQLDGRHRGGAVAEVDDDRGARGPPEPPRLRAREPAVAAAQPVGVRRPARDDTHGSVGSHPTSVDTARSGARCVRPRAPVPSPRPYPERVLDRLLRAQSREGEVSLSMVALVVSLAAALVLGLTSWVPRVLARDIGIADVEPGLLQVAQNAFGVQSLGAGLTVTLYDRGFRLSRGSTVLADTVTKGAPVIAIRGSVDRTGEHPREQVSSALTAVSIAAVARHDDDTVTYSGVVYNESESLPLRITFEPTDGRIRMDVAVQGASASPSTSTGAPRRQGSSPRCPRATSRRRPTGSTRPSSSSRPSPGSSEPTCRSPRSRCPARSTCARTGASRSTCGPRVRSSPSPTPLVAPWKTERMTSEAAPVRPRRVAMVSVHTSPLDQPGTGDAGGMNVYVLEVSRQLAASGWRSTSSPGRRARPSPTSSRSSPASSSGTSRPVRTRACPRRTCPASCAPSRPG